LKQDKRLSSLIIQGGEVRLEICCLSCVPLVPLSTTSVEISATAVDWPHDGRSLLVKSGVLMA